MPKFKSTEQAIQAIREIAKEALASSIKDAVVEQMASTTTDVVYRGYNPQYYQRRGQFDSTQSIQANAEGLTLVAKNITKPNDEGFNFHPPHAQATTGKDLAEVIQTGNGYDFWDEAFARPFNEQALSRILDKKIVEKGLAKALRAKGIKIKF